MPRSTSPFASGAATAGGRRCRCCGCRASASTPSRASISIAPNMFAGSVLDLEPGTAYDVRLTMADPDGVQGERSRTVTVSTRPEPQPYAGRPGLSCLPARPHRSEDRARVRGTDVRVQLLVRRNRLGDVGPAAGQAWRHDPRARRRLSIQPLRVHQQRQRQSHGAARRHVLPDRRRHRGHADRDQGGGRWGSRLRRRRQLRALRRARRRLHLLRGHHVPERRDRDSGRHAVHRRREGADGQEEPLRERRRRRVHQLRRLQQLLHRRQHVHRPQRSESPDRLERGVSGRSSTASRVRSFRRRWRRTSR